MKNSKYSRAAALVLACLSAGGIRSIAAATDYEVSPGSATCDDASYASAVKNGITVGLTEAPPYVVQDAQGHLSGVDVDINNAVFKWMGVEKVNYQLMPFSSIIPSLLSKRLDMVGINIHVTPDRQKILDFTGPAWWYGPALVVQQGNPLKIGSIDDLKGKRVGVLLGSASDEYLRAIGVNAQTFPANAEEFSSIMQGRLDVLMEDDAVFITFKNARPDAQLEMVKNVAIPADLLRKGYGYARYGLRKEDCSLRSMYDQGLSEVRGSGLVLDILTRYGFNSRNMFSFSLAD